MIREAYGDSVLSYSQVSRWLKAFKAEREEVHNDQRSERPPTSKIVRQTVHKEFRPEEQIVNTAFYVDVLERLRKRVVKTRKHISATWIVHHDNAPCHNALRVHQDTPERNAFLVDKRHPSGRDRGPKSGCGKRIPGRVPFMAGSLAKMCTSPREVL
ncbi:uncharacterized protein LOC143264850 isoform X2 [Megachile rotundata]|uniref:uncharacterized protein LOC143264850 isoform X2 n=1 Tax=Megachile rotundata TaxID=143995 RepID=UPI003FD2A091